MNQKYAVQLTEPERYQQKQLISSGTAPARKLRRADILLKSDSSIGGPNWKYKETHEAFEVSDVTISNTRKRYIESGLEAALERKASDRDYARRSDGEGEAHLIILACSEPPAAHERWTCMLC